MNGERRSLMERVEAVKNYSSTGTQEQQKEDPDTEKSKEMSEHREKKEEISHRRERKLSVFCVHGSKWGVAQCCQDMGETIKQDGKDGYNDSDVFNTSMDWEAENDPHCHQTREGGVDRKARSKLIQASVLCIVFMIGEVVGGVLANSLAIASDAAHLLSDFASFMISLVAIWIAARPNSHRMSFGWHRAEVLGAVVSVLLIWVVTGILVYMAIQRVISQDFEIEAVAMLITSGVGVAFNIVMGCTLHQHGHSHGGSNSHQERDSEVGSCDGEEREHENINVKAAFIHVVGDFLQSIGVFIAAIVIYFQPTWTLIDPICTFVFSIFVLATTIKILKDTLNVLMEGTPQGIDYDEVQKLFLSVPGIQTVHSLRIWALTTNKSALAAHLVITPGFSSTPGFSAQNVLQAATAVLRDKYKFYEMTLQVEEFQHTMEECTQCREPSN